MYREEWILWGLVIVIIVSIIGAFIGTVYSMINNRSSTQQDKSWLDYINDKEDK